MMATWKNASQVKSHEAPCSCRRGRGGGGQGVLSYCLPLEAGPWLKVPGLKGDDSHE